MVEKLVGTAIAQLALSSMKQIYQAAGDAAGLRAVEAREEPLRATRETVAAQVRAIREAEQRAGERAQPPAGRGVERRP